MAEVAMRPRFPSNLGNSMLDRRMFQVTSDESFEESLMAGGYGRYKTADWDRQPSLLVETNTAGPSLSGIMDMVRVVEEPVAPSTPITEKELRKRRRLAAFARTASEDSYKENEPNSAGRLRAIELDGKGRVLIDPSSLSFSSSSISFIKPDLPAKRRPRAKKGEAIDLSDQRIPDWPDDVFPWVLRNQVRILEEREEEERRMKRIEQYFDGDSDGDEDQPPPGTYSDVELATLAEWGVIYVQGQPVRKVVRRHNIGRFTNLKPLPDAQLAILSLYQKRLRTSEMAVDEVDDVSESLEAEPQAVDEIICSCQGNDDGREIIRCSGCQFPFHLECVQASHQPRCYTCRHCSRSDKVADVFVKPQPGIFMPAGITPRLQRALNLKNSTPTTHQSSQEDRISCTI
ncbi:hypothetical protein C8J56DRAFT_486890 [Mycena floridula]|nr:hypothetical protein C8J56DRAFT_486890 [Mycena floridula]